MLRYMTSNVNCLNDSDVVRISNGIRIRMHQHLIFFVTCLGIFLLAVQHNVVHVVVVNGFSSQQQQTTRTNRDRDRHEYVSRYENNNNNNDDKRRTTTTMIKAFKKEEDDESLPSKEEEKSSTNSPASALKKMTKIIGNGVFYVSSLLWSTVGLFFGLGILLNIMGYGYEFRKEDNTKFGIPRLHIDTIEQIRIDKQFNRASIQYEKEGGSSSSTLSSLYNTNNNNIATNQIKNDMPSTTTMAEATTMTTVESLLSPLVKIDN